MPYKSFEADLKKIGLSDREATVYLAALALGPSVVVQISRKSGVARPTTYLMLDNLVKRGLISIYAKADKQYYVAENPNHLREILKNQQDKLKEYGRSLDELIPKLQAFMWTEDLRPVVRYYDGKEGLRVMRSDMVRVSHPKDVWYSFSPLDYLHEVFGEKDFIYDRQRLARRIQSKTIFTTRAKALKEKLLAESDSRYAQRRFVPPDKFKSGTGITILRDRVALGTMEGKVGGFIVESSSVAQAMREIFDMAWKALEE